MVGRKDSHQAYVGVPYKIKLVICSVVIVTQFQLILVTDIFVVSQN